MYKAFYNYIPEDNISEVIDNNTRNLSKILKGTNKELTISFTNITGYVSIAEKLELSQLNDYINRYCKIIFKVIHEYGGIIEKFDADNIMAVFGVYESGSSFKNACSSSLKQLICINSEFNTWAKNINLPTLNIRVGIGSGDLIIVNTKSSENGAYILSVLGDSVNVASRLTEIAKNYDPGILVDEYTFSRIRGFSHSNEMENKDINIKYYQLTAIGS